MSASLARGARRAGSRRASSVTSSRKAAIWRVTVAASAFLRSPLRPTSHQTSPCAPSTMAMTAWLRISSYVGWRESVVNLKNCRTAQTGRSAGTAARSRAIESATMKWV